MLDFIGRLENIDEDFERFAAHVGIPTPGLPMVGTRAGRLAPRDAVKSAKAATRALDGSKPGAAATRYEGDLDLCRSLSGRSRGLGPAGATDVCFHAFE